MRPALHAFALNISALLLATVAIAACGQGDDAGNESRDDDGTCEARKEPLVGSCVSGGRASCAEYRGDLDRAAAEADCVGPDWQGTFFEGSCGEFHGRGGCVLSRFGGTVVLFEEGMDSSCEERDGCYFNDHVCTEPEPTATLVGSCTVGDQCWEVRGGDRTRDDWRQECTERANVWVWSDEACAYRFGGACARGQRGATVLEFTPRGLDPGEAEWWCGPASGCREFVRP